MAVSHGYVLTWSGRTAGFFRAALGLSCLRRLLALESAPWSFSESACCSPSPLFLVVDVDALVSDGLNVRVLKYSDLAIGQVSNVKLSFASFKGDDQQTHLRSAQALDRGPTNLRAASHSSKA